jgi:hypothetical protein
MVDKMKNQIPLKIRQKLSHIKNNLEKYNFTKEQLDKFNLILNEVWYEMDYKNKRQVK